jgi:hypothetical protein
MTTEIAFVCAGAALNLALWTALFLRLGTLPRAVWKLVQRRHAEDDARALDVLQGAAASRLGGLVVGVQTYHDELVRLARAEAAAVEVRARRTERQASDAAIALDAASTLVRDLRTLAEDLPSLVDRRAMRTALSVGEFAAHGETPGPAGGEERVPEEPPPGAPTPETVRKPDRPAPPSRLRPLTAPAEPPDDERVSGDDELTAVQTRPLPGARTLASAGAASKRTGGAP